jgi:UDP-N-acetylglucosamine pyrophosphorylase
VGRFEKLPIRKHKTFRARRKFEIKRKRSNFQNFNFEGKPYDIGFVEQKEFLNCNKQVVLTFQLDPSVRDFFSTFSPLGISHI